MANDEPESGGTDAAEGCAALVESPPPTPPKISLRDAHAIRRELANVYRDMRSGRIETSVGTRLAYVLDLIRKAYETGVLQERLDSVERTLAQRKERDKAIAVPAARGTGYRGQPWTPGKP